MDLELCRTQIDEIDRKLLELYLRRMRTVAEVARYKQEHGLPVFHPEREQAILQRQTEQAPEERRPFVRVFWMALRANSRAYQKELLSQTPDNKTPAP